MKKLMAFTIFIILIGSLELLAEENITQKTYKAIRNDKLAQKYSPQFIPLSNYDKPFTIYYRCAIDEKGNTYLAYHPTWTKEENSTSGLLPWLNRNIYTGGLKLQKILYGPGDIEAIAITIAPSGKIIFIQYERGANYNPKNFSVKHESIKLNGSFSTPIIFRITTWNHLFEFIEKPSNDTAAKSLNFKPEYFTTERWNYYQMIKIKENALSKNRAVFEWELISAE